MHICYLSPDDSELCVLPVIIECCLAGLVREQVFSRLLHHPTHMYHPQAKRDRIPTRMVSYKPCCESGSGISSEPGSGSRVLKTKT